MSRVLREKSSFTAKDSLKNTISKGGNKKSVLNPLSSILSNLLQSQQEESKNEKSTRILSFEKMLNLNDEEKCTEFLNSRFEFACDELEKHYQEALLLKSKICFCLCFNFNFNLEKREEAACVHESLRNYALNKIEQYQKLKVK